MSDKTIVSQSTPLGFSAIAVIRLSGDNAIKISKKISKNYKPLKHRTAEVRNIYSGADLIDQAVFTAFLSPNSYTGEDVVEISCHGNLHVCESTINEIVKLGARIAEPGEYTKRAFVNGKLNLLQAESVIQLINARSIEAVKQQTKNLSGGTTVKLLELKANLISNLAYLEYELDVSEDVLINEKNLKKIRTNIKNNLKTANLMSETFGRGNALSNGVKIVFVGKPNVGKSTLVNKIVGMEKSITSDVPGTTRDTVSTETIIGGIPVTLVDTAGIHVSDNEIEIEGIKRSYKEIETGDIIINLFCNDSEIVDINKDKDQIYVYNKIDSLPYSGKNEKVFPVSATTGKGLKSLINHIEKKVGFLRVDAAEPLLTTIRQKEAMDNISSCLKAAMMFLENSSNEIELPAEEIKNAISNIDLFTGKTTTNDILERVFSSFCVGK